jgi:hypothetical protein
MKIFFVIAVLFTILSCSSGDRPVSRHDPDKSSPEIGTATMSGGETVDIRGYTSDSEANRQLKLIDLEIIDCYRQNVGRIGITEILLDYAFYIDRNGKPADIRYKANPENAAILGDCIKRDIHTLSFRPGSPRDITSYRLVFKPEPKIKQNDIVSGTTDRHYTKKEDPRSKMIKSLSDMDTFRDCYEEEIKRTPGIGGKFTLRFLVSEYGDVENVEIVHSTFNEPKVPLCVVKKLADIRFPRGETDDIVEVNFEFSPSGPMKRRRTMDIDM